MPYDNYGTGFNAGVYTSWLAAMQQKSKRLTQKIKILGLYEAGAGVIRQGHLRGISSWHVKTLLSEMFSKGKTTAWTARLADMTADGTLSKIEGERHRDGEGVLRDLYFRTADLQNLPDFIQPELGLDNA